MDGKNVFDSLSVCLDALKKGEIIILADSQKRENEGDFVLAASRASEEKINFMLSEGRGILCVAVPEKKAVSLGLNRMASNTDRFQTPFTVSVDAITAFSGVSVPDRLKTIKLLSSSNAKPADFVRPGHVFPLVARPFGVLERAGHTEASVDLVRMAGLPEAAVIIEIMNRRGKMSSLKELSLLKKKHGLKMLSVEQLVDFRLANENILEKIASPIVPTEFGKLRVVGFRDKIFGREFVAVVKGVVRGKNGVLSRVHSACFTGDVLHSRRCDCRDQLVESLRIISKNGGMVVYALEHEGRGIGLVNKLRAYELQDKGLDTVQANTALGFEPDQRNYAMSAQVIKALGVKSVKLLSNNPLKAMELRKFGVRVLDCVPLKTQPNRYNWHYLETKKTKMAHLL